MSRVDRILGLWVSGEHQSFLVVLVKKVKTTSEVAVPVEKTDARK
jgi:hypothetical protein